MTDRKVRKRKVRTSCPKSTTLTKEQETQQAYADQLTVTAMITESGLRQILTSTEYFTEVEWQAIKDNVDHLMALRTKIRLIREGLKA